MPHLVTRVPKLLALAGSAALAAFLFVGSGHAATAPGQGLKVFATPALPVEQAGYYKRYYRSYPPYSLRDYYVDYGRYRHWRGSDEVRELQRLFPGTNWPPSMRYHQY